jgi:hypothetical protein
MTSVFVCVIQCMPCDYLIFSLLSKLPVSLLSVDMTVYDLMFILLMFTQIFYIVFYFFFIALNYQFLVYDGFLI